MCVRMCVHVGQALVTVSWNTTVLGCVCVCVCVCVYGWMPGLVTLPDFGTCPSQFSDSYKSTIGVDFALKVVHMDDWMVRMQLWDIAGLFGGRYLLSRSHAHAHTHTHSCVMSMYVCENVYSFVVGCSVCTCVPVTALLFVGGCCCCPRFHAPGWNGPCIVHREEFCESGVLENGPFCGFLPVTFLCSFSCGFLSLH